MIRILAPIYLTKSQNRGFLKFAVGAAFVLLLIGFARTLHSPSALDIDGAEQIYLSQWLELGFGIQPPLPTWLLHILVKGVGYSVATMQFFRLSAIFFVYIGIFRLTDIVLRNQKLALSCTLSFVFILQFSSEMLRQMHTVFATLAVVYAWIVLLKIHAYGKTKSYLWLGFWIGIGLLSKYNFILHVLVTLITALSFVSFREKLITPKTFLTLFIALVICLQHYSWLISNLMEVSSGVNSDLATSKEMSMVQSALNGLGAYLISLLSFTGILTTVVGIFFFRRFKRRKADRHEILFFERYILISTLALLSVVMITKADVFHEHWLQPFLIIFPIVLFDRLGGLEEVDITRFNRFNAFCMVMFLFVTSNYAFKSGIRVISGDRNSVFNVPYQEMADVIESWPSVETILTKDVRTAGHLKMLLPEKVVLVEHDLHHLKIERDRLLNSDNTIFIWKATGDKGNIPLKKRNLREVMDQAISVEVGPPKIFNLNYIFTDDQPYNVGLATFSIRAIIDED